MLGKLGSGPLSQAPACLTDVDKRLMPSSSHSIEAGSAWNVFLVGRKICIEWYPFGPSERDHASQFSGVCLSVRGCGFASSLTYQLFATMGPGRLEANKKPMPHPRSPRLPARFFVGLLHLYSPTNDFDSAIGSEKVPHVIVSAFITLTLTNHKLPKSPELLGQEG
jgi:hypothetical protein